MKMLTSFQFYPPSPQKNNNNKYHKATEIHLPIAWDGQESLWVSQDPELPAQHVISKGLHTRSKHCKGLTDVHCTAATVGHSDALLGACCCRGSRETKRQWPFLTSIKSVSGPEKVNNHLAECWHKRWTPKCTGKGFHYKANPKRLFNTSHLNTVNMYVKCL